MLIAAGRIFHAGGHSAHGHNASGAGEGHQPKGQDWRERGEAPLVIARNPQWQVVAQVWEVPAARMPGLAPAWEAREASRQAAVRASAGPMGSTPVQEPISVDPVASAPVSVRALAERAA